jgi:WD40 repeat protein
VAAGQILGDFTPDEANTRIFIYDADTGDLLHRLLGHTDRVTDLTWSADSRLLASASIDGTARLFDTQTGEQVTTLFEGLALSSIAWSPDGRIAVGSYYEAGVYILRN